MSTSRMPRVATLLAIAVVALTTGCAATGPSTHPARQLNLNPGTAGQDCAEDADGNPVDVGLSGHCR